MELNVETYEELVDFVNKKNINKLKDYSITVNSNPPFDDIPNVTFIYLALHNLVDMIQ